MSYVSPAPYASFYTGGSKRASTVHYTSHQAGSHQQHPTLDETSQRGPAVAVEAPSLFNHPPQRPAALKKFLYLCSRNLSGWQTRKEIFSSGKQ